MDMIKLQNEYIPAGCLKVPIDETVGSLLKPSILKDQDWKFFSSLGIQEIPPEFCLPVAVQDALLALPSLQPCTILREVDWVKMSFNQVVDSDGFGFIRVYILPDGHDPEYFDPRPGVFKATCWLLNHLDRPDACWYGYSLPSAPRISSAGDETLLSMFNNVPSPDPRPEQEPRPDTRDGMKCLMQSQLPGLTTKLYPYQRRSAAVMFQREENPGIVANFRYKSALDQRGNPWYFDDVKGDISKEPKYYERVRGGILAEEMGTGKTLICLALILCTQHEPARVPDPFLAQVPPRNKKGVPSLMDLAAATANKHSVSWKPYFYADPTREYTNCVRALTAKENQAYYEISDLWDMPRKTSRAASRPVDARKVYLSSATVIVVPNNLVKQWQNEINKHTTGLKVLVLVDNQAIPSPDELLGYDILLFSEGRLELTEKEHSNNQGIHSPLENIRFKRCIVDEGHKLGNRHKSWKSNVMRALDRLEANARWVVTGTPSRGLYGVDQQPSETNDTSKESTEGSLQSTLEQERDDLHRIGNLAVKFLKVRPWANKSEELGDRVADWTIYVMHPKQHHLGHNRKDCVQSTLNSLIIRHRRSDINNLLPQVDEKTVVLEGSFQDKLSLNLFSMMIIFNSVQSQRTDRDYFFHERQRKSLHLLVKNLRQACFFGGVFYSVEDIQKALETAEEFLAKGEVPITAVDKNLFEQAISFGKLAVSNQLKETSNKFHAMPLYLEGFPGGGKSWSLDSKEVDGQPICTDSGMISALQKFLSPCIDAPQSLQLMIESGRLDQQGEAERSHALTSAAEASGRVTIETTMGRTLAGNTPLGVDRHSKPKSGALKKGLATLKEKDQAPKGHGEIAELLENTKIISTVSVKLSYLIDSIVKYQGEEKVIVFYDNDNIAYYLAGVLEILQIEHLIYAKADLSAQRRSQYVETFNQIPKFRVMLMDISQAAFGLDMRSASRIYFISPVLNPQVEAQAIGRARRISQQKPVSVETLVLKHSIEEVIMNRRGKMSQAESSQLKSVLDDRWMYHWILRPKIIPMPDVEDGVAQTAMLETPQVIFGRGFGRELHPDDGLITGSPESKEKATSLNGNAGVPFKIANGRKRPTPATCDSRGESNGTAAQNERPPKRRGRVTFAD